jgi:hypothetical protein
LVVEPFGLPELGLAPPRLGAFFLAGFID